MPPPKHPPVPGMRSIISQEFYPGSRVGDHLQVNGYACTVVSARQAEKCDFVVCSGAAVPTRFADNQRGPCADCGDPLQWRPHAPKRPPKLCIDCAMIRANGT